MPIPHYILIISKSYPVLHPQWIWLKILTAESQSNYKVYFIITKFIFNFKRKRLDKKIYILGIGVT